MSGKTTPVQRILGLDPGLARVGYAVVEAGHELRPLGFGVICTSSNRSPAQRIAEIADAVEALLREYDVELAALEELFFARNVSSALTVAQVRGALLLVLARAGLPMVACAPNTVKLAVCGNGHATKRDVARMSARLLRLDTPPRQADAADALAIAITASLRSPLSAEPI